MKNEIRRKDRAVTDINQIVRILQKAKILHLGLIDDGCPYIVPLHYGYVCDRRRGTIEFYMHSAREGRKISLIRQNPNVCVELEADVHPTSGDGIPCEYGSLYSSLIGWGRATIVEDAQEKKRALNLFMENQTGMDFTFTDEMVSGVSVIRVDIRDYTAKARTKNG